MKNTFCFILKAFFVLKIFNTFWSYRKNSLTRKIKLTANLMMSQPGQQTIAIHILTNISRSKGNQTVKLGQLIEYNKRNIFLQKLCKKWGREISPLFVFKKSFQYVSIALKLAYNKIKRYKTLDYRSRDKLNFNFSEKGLGLVSLSHFVYNFSRKMFLMLHSINWPNFIVRLLLLLEILGSMWINIVC